MGDLFDDPQIASMGLVEEIEGPDGALRVPVPSIRFERSGRPELRYAPALGADTEAVTGLRSASEPADSESVRPKEGAA
jgi:formyl-CoA transferase